MKVKIFFFILSIISSQYLLAVTATWTAVNGNWDNPSNWSTNLIPDASTDVVIPIPGDVTIPAGFTASALSVTIQGVAELFIAETAVLNVTGSTTDAITIIGGGQLHNKGFINVGNGGTTGGNAFVIQQSTTKLFNDTTGVINVNNIVNFAFNLNLLGKVINAGDINIGAVGPIGDGGFAADFDSQIDNHGTGTIQVNNCPTGDGFYMLNSNITNDGEIIIGNISNVLGRGLSLAEGCIFSNGFNATLSISRITNSGVLEGIGLYMSDSNFSNSGDVFIGNNGTVNNTGVYIEFESSFTNSSNGEIHINNITTNRGISLKDDFTFFSNSGMIRIGNTGTVRSYGIAVLSTANFTNNSAGQIHIDNMNGTGAGQGTAIICSAAGFTNTGSIVIGTNNTITQYGIVVNAGGGFLNQSTGNISINRITNFDGIQLETSGTTFTNNGTINIGNLQSVKGRGLNIITNATFTNGINSIITINTITGTLSGEGTGIFLSAGNLVNSGSINVGNINPIQRYGIFLQSTSTLQNQSSGSININKITAIDGIQSSGSTITNSGMIRIGNINAVNRYGIFISTGNLTNSVSGVIEINNILSTAASEGYGLVNSAATINNNGIIRIGNIGNIYRFGVFLASAAIFNNNNNASLTIDNIISTTINEGIALRIQNNNSTVNNSGNITIGNIGPVSRFGIVMSSISQLNNSSTGLININRITINSGISVQVTAKITNAGIVNVGNTQSVNEVGILLVGGEFVNNMGGNVSVNRTLVLNGISINGTGAKFTNNATVNIGNTDPIQRLGISIFSNGEFLNNVGGNVSVNRITLYDGIYINGVGSKFTNNATVNVGNLTMVNESGIYLDLGSLFQNNSTGVVNVNNTNLSAILADGTGTVFNNNGLVNLQ